ncbi:hypothetical protein U0070_026767 [Myodes glareolus]|uniref:Uncharacterized protein n=1 Tax=Myodes glareolus TaxID=447135 RepID=A0AAW0HXX8_MYOGA
MTWRPTCEVALGTRDGRWVSLLRRSEATARSPASIPAQGLNPVPSKVQHLPVMNPRPWPAVDETKMLASIDQDNGGRQGAQTDQLVLASREFLE